MDEAPVNDFEKLLEEPMQDLSINETELEATMSQNKAL
jgi:hypothetical protein